MDRIEPADPAAAPAVFISYSRRDTAAALELLEGLRAHGLDAWLDQREIAGGENWRAEIERGITLAQAVVFVVSAHLLSSDDCQWELQVAVDTGKHLVPWVVDATTPEQLPAALQAFQVIDARLAANRRAALAVAAAAAGRDLEWRRRHTDLTARALQWQQSGRDPARLLGGTALAEAQRLLARLGVSGTLRPTTGQVEFVEASAQAEQDEAARRQRQANRLRAQGLAAQAEQRRARDIREIELSVLLAVQALGLDDSPITREALERGLKLLAPSDGRPIDLGSESIHALTFSPDGRWLVAGDSEGHVVVIDAGCGAILHRVPAGDRVWSLAVSADSRWAAACGYGWTEVVLVNLQAGAVARRLPHPTPVEQFAFDPQSSTIVCMADGQPPHCWPLESDAPAQSLPAATPARAVAFSADGHWCATGGREGLQIWAWPERELRWTHPFETGECAFNADGSQLYAASLAGGDVIRLDLAARRNDHLLTHERSVSALAISADGRFVASVGQEQVLRVHDAQVGQLGLIESPPGGTQRIHLHADSRSIALQAAAVLVLDVELRELVTQLPSATALAWHPHERRLAAARGGRIDIHTLDRDGPAVLRHGRRLAGATLSANGRFVAQAGTDARIEVAELAGGRLRSSVPGPAEIDHLSLADDGRTLVVQTEHPSALIAWDVAAARQLWQRGANAEGLGWLRRSAMSDDGQWITQQANHLADQTTPLHIIRCSDGQIALTLAHDANGQAAFGPDGGSVASVSGGCVELHALPLGTRLARWPVTGRIGALAFSTDGTRLAVVDYDGAVRVHAVGDGRLLYECAPGDGYACAVAWSPCGRWLAHSGMEAVHLWHAADGRPARQMPIEWSADCIVFSHSGDHLAAGLRAGELRIWHCESGRIEARRSHDEEVFDVQFDADDRYVIVEHVRHVRRWRTAWLWQPHDLLELARRSVTRELSAAERAEYLGDDAAGAA